MKKLLILLCGLMFIITPLILTSCSDSDDDDDKPKISLGSVEISSGVKDGSTYTIGTSHKAKLTIKTNKGEDYEPLPANIKYEWTVDEEVSEEEGETFDIKGLTAGEHSLKVKVTIGKVSKVSAEISFTISSYSVAITAPAVVEYNKGAYAPPLVATVTDGKGGAVTSNITYAWSVNGKAAGTNSKNYTIDTTNAGQQVIHLTVTIGGTNYECDADVTINIKEGGSSGGGSGHSYRATILGAPSAFNEGSTTAGTLSLQVTDGVSVVAPASYTCKWIDSSKPDAPLATSATYSLKDLKQGSYSIYAIVTIGGEDVVSSVVSFVVNPKDAKYNVTITGFNSGAEYNVGATIPALTATVTPIKAGDTVDEAKITYKWVLNNGTTAVSTVKTYTPKATTAGSQTIQVTVTIQGENAPLVATISLEVKEVTYTASISSTSSLSAIEQNTKTSLPLLSVVVTPTPTGTLTYAWSIDNVSKGTAATYQIVADDVKTIGNKAVKVAVSLGGKEIASANTTLSVIKPTNAQFRLSGKLENQTLKIGDNSEDYSIRVESLTGQDISSNADVSYTWYIGGKKQDAVTGASGGSTCTPASPAFDNSKAGRTSIRVAVTYKDITLTSNTATITIEKEIARKPILETSSYMYTARLRDAQYRFGPGIVNPSSNDPIVIKNQADLDNEENSTLSSVWYEVGAGPNGADVELTNGKSGNSVLPYTKAYKQKSDLGLKHYYCLITNTKVASTGNLTASARFDAYVNVIPINAIEPDLGNIKSQTVKITEVNDATKGLKDLEVVINNKKEISDQSGSLTYQWYKQEGYVAYKTDAGVDLGQQEVHLTNEIDMDVLTYGGAVAINGATYASLSDMNKGLAKAARTDTEGEGDDKHLVLAKDDNGKFITAAAGITSDPVQFAKDTAFGVGSDIDRFTKYYCVVTNTLKNIADDGGVHKVSVRTNDVLVRISNKKVAATPICVPFWDGNTYELGKGPIKRAYAYALDGGTITYRWYVDKELVEGTDPSSPLFNTNKYIKTAGSHTIGLAVTNTNNAADVDIKTASWDYWTYFPANITFVNPGEGGQIANTTPINGDIGVTTSPSSSLAASFDCWKDSAKVYAYAYDANDNFEWVACDSGSIIDKLKGSNYVHFKISSGDKIGFILYRFPKDAAAPTTKDDIKNAVNMTSDAIGSGENWTAQWGSASGGSGSASTTTPDTPSGGGTGSEDKEEEEVVIEQVKSPTLTPANNSEVQESIDVKFNCDTAGATIYFTYSENPTLPPADPTTESINCDLLPTKNSYLSKLSENGTAKDLTIKAFAVKSGMTASSVVTYHYTINPKPVAPPTSTEKTYTITGIPTWYPNDNNVFIIHLWEGESELDIALPNDAYKDGSISFTTSATFTDFIIARMPAGSTSLSGTVNNQSADLSFEEGQTTTAYKE